MLLHIPVYPNSVIATSTAPCLRLSREHKSERVRSQFRTGRMIALKKEGQRLLKKKQKSHFGKKTLFWKAKKAELYGTIK